jgi:hypothetical protein
MTETPLPIPLSTPLLRAFTLVEVAVLMAAGFALLVLPDLAHDQWPWAPAPFNTAFLGAIYSASLVPVSAMLSGRRAPLRVVLPMLAVFTAIVLVVSLFYLEQFQLDRWSNWVWFPLYVLLPFNAAYHMWLHRNLTPADRNPTPPAWRRYLLGVALAMGGYGLGLLIAPEPLTAFWPWAIDAFHGRMYSAVLIAGAVGAFTMWRAATRTELAAVGLTHASFGLLSVVGLLIVDATERRVGWSRPGTWLWVGALATGCVGGVLMAWGGRQRTHPKRHTPPSSGVQGG